MVLWAGSLWSLALWVAPTLFSLQSDRHLAGMLVTRLFSVETYVALAVSALALLFQGPLPRGSLSQGPLSQGPLSQAPRFRFAYLAALLLAIDEWLLKPLLNRAHIGGQAMGLGFGAWHGISALVYVTACLLVLLSIWNDDLR